MTERPRAHCRKHAEHDILCPVCAKLDEIAERSFQVVHARDGKKPKKPKKDALSGPSRNLDEWAQSMVEAAEARKKFELSPESPATVEPENEVQS